MYYGYLGPIIRMSPDYQGVLIFQVSFYDEQPVGAVTKCVDYVGVIKCPDQHNTYLPLNFNVMYLVFKYMYIMC